MLPIWMIQVLPDSIKAVLLIIISYLRTKNFLYDGLSQQWGYSRQFLNQFLRDF